MLTTPRRESRPSRAVLLTFAAIALVATVVAACGAAVTEARTITLRTLNESGVTGTVSFSDLGAKTSVEVSVNPGGNLDMPAHIHPGTCDTLTPQPKFPLENVRNGVSKTVVPAPIAELFAGGLAVNVHKSNDDLKTYTACVDIR
jgi:hypothetical protein